MNILYACQRVPYPPNRGDKIPSYNAIRYLARRHRVCVATLADSPEELEHARKLEKQGFAVDVALLSPWQRRINALRALVTSTPLSLAYYRSGRLAAMVRERARLERFDVALAFCSSMGQYAALLPDVPLVNDFVDLDSQKWSLYAEFAPWPKSWIYRLENRRLLACERELARRARCTLVRTHAELEDCRRLLGDVSLDVLANGVDLDYFKSAGAKSSSPEIAGPDVAGPDIVFTGVMDYFPNVQGVQFFCDRVLPLIRRQIPSATFTIVGSRPTKPVEALARIEGVRVTGRVPDVRPFLERAAVAVAPLKLARGIQNKILEAMAMSTPVVATEAAFRGLDAAEGEGVLVADDPEEFAAAVVGLLADEDRARALGALGRKIVETRYVWEEKLAKLEELLAKAASSRPSVAIGGSVNRAP